MKAPLLLCLSLCALPFSGFGQIYSSSYSSNEVYLFDETTGALIGGSAFVTAGSGGLSLPHGIIDRGYDIIVTSFGTNEVLRFDRATGAYLGDFISAGYGISQPTYMEHGPDDGDLYISSQGNDRIYRVHPQGDTAVPVGVGPFVASAGELDGPSGFDWSPDGSILYVAGRYSTNVVSYNAATGALLGVFADTSADNNNTFGLAVDNATGDVFVAVSGDVKRYNSAGTLLVTIAVPGTPIGLELSEDGNSILVGANNNLYAIAISDNSVSAPFYSSGTGGLNLHNFFHVSRQNLDPRSAPVPITGSLVAAAGDHLAVTFEGDETALGIHYAVQLSSNLITWSDGATYTPTGSGIPRDLSGDTVQVSYQDNGSTVAITERQASNTSSQDRAFARVLRRKNP